MRSLYRVWDILSVVYENGFSVIWNCFPEHPRTTFSSDEFWCNLFFGFGKLVFRTVHVAFGCLQNSKQLLNNIKNGT
jgi:hypothetical protein